MDASNVTYRPSLIIGITTAVLILAILSYILRIYARQISKAKLWYDDYLMGVGLVSEIKHPVFLSLLGWERMPTGKLVICFNSLRLQLRRHV